MSLSLSFLSSSSISKSLSLSTSLRYRPLAHPSLLTPLRFLSFSSSPFPSHFHSFHKSIPIPIYSTIGYIPSPSYITFPSLAFPFSSSAAPRPSPSSPSLSPSSPSPPFVIPSHLTAYDVLHQTAHIGVFASVYPHETIIEVARKMREKDIGVAVIVEEIKSQNSQKSKSSNPNPKGTVVEEQEFGDAEVMGIITERDILKYLSSSSDSPSSSPPAPSSPLLLPVSALMTNYSDLIFSSPSDSVSSCLTLMNLKGFRHLPVMEKKKDISILHGIISMRLIIQTAMAVENEKIMIENENTRINNNNNNDPHENKSKDAVTHLTGKAHYMFHVLPRLGLPPHTRLRLLSSLTDISQMKKKNTKGKKFHFFLKSAAKMIPSPDKINSPGEDSYAIFNPKSATNPKMSEIQSNIFDSQKKYFPPIPLNSSHPSTTSVISIFDGIGVWSIEKKINVSLFSQKLAESVVNSIKTHILPSSPSPSHPSPSSSSPSPSSTSPPLSSSLFPFPLPSPRNILDSCWTSIQSSKLIGSSTAVIITMKSDSNELRASVLGDSGFIILRKGKAGISSPSNALSLAPSLTPKYSLFYRSPVQLHEMNCPFQLGINESLLPHLNVPSDAENILVRVEVGDILIVASDGLFDNVDEEEIIRITNGVVEESEGGSIDIPTTLTTRLVDRALSLMFDKSVDSPYALMSKENNKFWSGGRKDDCTVVVAQVDFHVE